MSRFQLRKFGLSRVCFGVAVVLIGTFVVGANAGDENTAVSARSKTDEVDRSAPLPRQGRQRFPDFKLENKPPESQHPDPQHLFRMSQDFPTDVPNVSDDPAVARILAIPYDENDGGKKNWLKYLIAVRDYCLEGNVDRKDVPAAEIDYDDDWQQEFTFENWYHVPWQHWGDKGREGIHGLTREASARAGQLGRTHVNIHETHAVAVYNRIGGYTIGKVWENQFEPNLQAARFKPGAIVVKVLFTQAGEDEVPYLHDGLVWKAYIRDPKDPTKRKVQKLRLLQMDVMVRDPRADKTGGWVFGTYCYNGSVKSTNKWYRLVPVGIQWGNDPEFNDWQANQNHTSPFAIKRGAQSHLSETIINDAKELPPQHLGWGGRLNGPADYFRSSCMSCHATAQYPGHSPQHPDFESLGHEPGGEAWMRWFRNLNCGESFDSRRSGKKQAVSMDFSLQLQIGIENFYQWKSSAMGGYFTFRDETHPVSSEPTK